MSIDEFYSLIQEEALPAIWSKGVGAARNQAVVLDQEGSDELSFRFRAVGSPVSVKVSLWPADQDWFCDCKEKTDPCFHVVAALVAYKNDWVKRDGAADGDATSDSSVERPASNVQTIEYHFTRDKLSTGTQLAFERKLNDQGKVTRLSQSLVSLVGGILSGRVHEKQVAATKPDYALEQILEGHVHGVLSQSKLLA